MGDNPSHFKDPAKPVDSVSFEDARRFIGRINQRVAGLDLDLPTEAMWEYACRAGTTTPFSCGNNITSDQANFHGNYPYADNPKGQCRRKTVAVGSLPANDWGLFEMHGNLWEWCRYDMREYSAEGDRQVEVCSRRDRWIGWRFGALMSTS